ncbi:MAG: 2',3'-cyclic-nucleotide 2'-phosphodiesterase [bacterium]|nr:MAG: 2',3'-cyclic-nucleotide 2'-phosphodiesterase [bacterium]
MKKILLLISLFLSVTLFAQNGEPANTIHLKILETGDVHGSVFPQDLVKQRIRRGSLAQVETYVKDLRADKNQTVILLDDGDILQGTPFVYYYNYVDTTEVHQLAIVMNYMRYAAGTVGNHDIEPGHAVFDKFRKEIDFPWLAANAVVDSTGKPYFKPYVILHRDGLKIVVFGMVTPGIPNWLAPSIWSGMHFEGMVKTARYWVKYIRNHEHPDLLIGLFHSGTDSHYGASDNGQPLENASEVVAREVPGFDVVFAGHDHRPSNATVTNAAGKEVLLIDAGAHAELVSEADINLTYNPKTGRYEKTITGHLRSMSGYTPDSAFMQKFMPDFIQVQKFVNKPIGKFTKTVDAGNALFGPSAFVDIIHQLQLKETHADVSIVSLLSMNARIDKGVFYMRDMFKLYRFENYLYTIRLSGREIKNLLEYSYGLWFNTMQSKKDHLLLFKTDARGNLALSKWTGRPYLKNAYYNFNSAAGIRYVVDVSKKPGNRIHILSMADGKPFDMNKTYTVAINSYQGNGGGGTLTEGAGISKPELSKRLISSSKKDIRYLMMKWIERQGVVTPKALDEWKIIPEKWVNPATKRDRELLFGEKD